MKKIKSSRSVLIVVLAAAVAIVPHIAHAHEVYVLTPTEIAAALHAPRPDFFDTLIAHLPQFLGWGLLTLIGIMAVFFVSITKPIERLIDPVLNRLKIAAPWIAQFTIGIALIASGYYGAVFGTELPTHALAGSHAALANGVLIAIGALLMLGIVPRIAAALTIVCFGVLVAHYGTYMLTYALYFGEALTIFLYGGAYHLFESRRLGSAIERIERRLAPHLHKYKFLIMRIFFGISLVYASLYAKLIHGALALDTVQKYHLTNYFHFDPVFLVLGAMTVELMLGLFFAFGFEIRFASLFFLTFLTMSLVFFGEAVWPHLILIGTALAMFSHGYDKYCLSARLFSKSLLRKNSREQLEPVL